MNYRHHLVTQTLALLPTHRLICLAARFAYRQQGPCPPLWRPLKLYQYHRRRQVLNWLQACVTRSLQGHEFVDSYFRSQNLPQATLLHVRTAYLRDLLNYTTEDSPTLAFEDYLPIKPTKPTDPDLQTLPGCV